MHKKLLQQKMGGIDQLCQLYGSIPPPARCPTHTYSFKHCEGVATISDLIIHILIWVPPSSCHHMKKSTALSVRV